MSPAAAAGHSSMSTVTCQISISLDGFVAGPNQSIDNPIGEVYLHVVPIVLGSGERLLENIGEPTLEPIKVVASPAVTHVKYRVVR
jgi:hypothetical protein